MCVHEWNKCVVSNEKTKFSMKCDLLYILSKIKQN